MSEKKGKPRRHPALGEGVEGSATGSGVDEVAERQGPKLLDIPLKPGTEPRTDAANAQRFLFKNGHLFRCCWEYGGWLCWDGRRYTPDVKGVVARDLMRKCGAQLFGEAQIRVNDILDELKTADQDTKAEVKRRLSQATKIRTWGRDSQQTARVSSSLKAAEEPDGVTVEASELDADGWILNCLNGVLDLRTGELKKHDPQILITRITGCEWSPEATAPQWDKFLNEVLPDEEVRRWLQQWVGTCLTTSIADRVIALFLGVGANGKTVLLDVLSHVMGDYAASTSPEFFATSRGGINNLEYQIAQIHGARLLRAAETKTGAMLNESLLKQVSGGDPCQGRHPYGRPFEFNPVCKPVLATNNQPKVQDTSRAIFDRLAPVDFPRRFEKREQDRELTGRLKTEAPGVLRWAFDGLQAWRENNNRLTEAASIVLAVDDYRRDEDTLDGFFTEDVLVDGDLRISVGDLYSQYEIWAELEKIKKPWGKIRFGKELKRRGFKQLRTGKVREWRGIGLRGATGESRPQDRVNQQPIDFQSRASGEETTEY